MKIAKHNDHLHENRVVRWFLEFFHGLGYFLPICYFYASCFLRIISSWLTPVFSVSFLTKQSTKFLLEKQPNAVNNLCHRKWWKLAQLKVFVFDENKLEEMFSQSHGTLNHHFLVDVWWNNHFLWNDLESSSWNNHKKLVVWSSRQKSSGVCFGLSSSIVICLNWWNIGLWLNMRIQSYSDHQIFQVNPTWKSTRNVLSKKWGCKSQMYQPVDVNTGS